MAPLLEGLRGSIAARMAAWFALVALLSFSIVGLSLRWVLLHELTRHQTEQLRARTADMEYMLLHARPQGLAERVLAKIEALSPADGRNRYWLWSPDPAYRYGADLDLALAATRERSEPTELEMHGRRLRVQAIELPAHGERPALRFIVGIDDAPFAQTRRSFELAVLVIILLGSAGVAGVGYWVARRGLLPVRRMSDEAQRIKPRQPAQRLELQRLPRELSDLGRSLNAALDRLDVAYHQLETFNDNVAHELRTPLANLIGLTQVALSRERGATELREVLLSNLEELERLRSIVADMLFLARAEQGALAQDRVPASLATEVGKTLEFMDLLFEEAGMRVRVEGEAQAPIQSALFRRALTNLLHNAIQHSPPGSEIVVQIRSAPGSASVGVRNPGNDIPAEHLPRLFDRFYRIEKSRVNSGESHGLGLAIVKAVALMHQGQVFVESGQGVTLVGLQVQGL